VRATPASSVCLLLALALATGCGAASAGQSVRAEVPRADAAAPTELSATASRMAWIVRLSDTLGRSSPALECVAAGIACGIDDMLDVDTTRLRAGSLEDALTRALDPDDVEYLGPPGRATLDLAHRTAAAATRVADLLGRWLSSGCGSNVEGIAVTSHPPACDDLTVSSTRAVQALESVLAGWPAP
jgi:hypothetical protein